MAIVQHNSDTSKPLSPPWSLPPYLQGTIRHGRTLWPPDWCTWLLHTGKCPDMHTMIFPFTWHAFSPFAYDILPFSPQELVNLILTGRAVSNVFDDTITLDSGASQKVRDIALASSLNKQTTFAECLERYPPAFRCRLSLIVRALRILSGMYGGLQYDLLSLSSPPHPQWMVPQRLVAITRPHAIPSLWCAVRATFSSSSAPPGNCWRPGTCICVCLHYSGLHILDKKVVFL